MHCDASLADMEKGQQHSDGLARAIYPDEEERSERTKLIQSLMVGHTSAIIRVVQYSRNKTISTEESVPLGK